LLYRESDEYAQAIREAPSVDLVLVDGDHRPQCIKNTVKHVNDEAVIILDDSYRTKYKECFDILIENGYNNISFQGMGPVNARRQRSTMFYKESNILGI
jgi:hypothetical protein